MISDEQLDEMEDSAETYGAHIGLSHDEIMKLIQALKKEREDSDLLVKGFKKCREDKKILVEALREIEKKSDSYKRARDSYECGEEDGLSQCAFIAEQALEKVKK